MPDSPAISAPAHLRSNHRGGIDLAIAPRRGYSRARGGPRHLGVSNLGSKHVLLVEDNNVTRRAIARALHSRGTEVVDAEALERKLREHLDLQDDEGAERA
jgi:hypothetical protein